MSEIVIGEKGFIRSCLDLFFYGRQKCIFTWFMSILCASAGIVFSAGAVISLTFAIIKGPDVTPIYNQYQFTLTYADFFYFLSFVGIISYMLTFKLESYFLSVIQNYGQVSKLESKKVDRQRALVRILACRIKYLVAPYFFIFLAVLSLALIQKQFAVFFLVLLVSLLAALQDKAQVSKFALIVFTDRAMTPLKLGLSRLVVVVIMGGLLVSFHSYFNFFSFLVVMSFLALAVHLMRCWNLYNKIQGFL